MEIDSRVMVTFTRYTSNVRFHPANAGYSSGKPPVCFAASGDAQSRLTYHVYKYEMEYADFHEESFFAALAKMSTLKGVLAHGSKVSQFV